MSIKCKYFVGIKGGAISTVTKCQYFVGFKGGVISINPKRVRNNWPQQCFEGEVGSIIEKPTFSLGFLIDGQRCPN